MTLEEFLKSIDYEVKMDVLGEVKNYRYYVQVDLPNNEDVGEPLVVEENKNKHTFKVCASDQASELINLFW